MDLKAIEAALAKCLVAEDLCHEQDNPSHDEMVTAMALWTDKAEELAMRHGMDILRLVRAMGWMEAERFDVEFTDDEWCVVDWTQDMEDRKLGIGPTPLDAIEAAIQQTKGATDEA